MKTIARIGLAGLTATTLYLAACIPNSVRMNHVLKETKYAEVFKEIAENHGSLRFDQKTSRSYLDYDGLLVNIVKRADEFLGLNDSVRMGRWRVTQDYKTVEGEESLIVDVSTPTAVFCYNPFKKIN